MTKTTFDTFAGKLPEPSGGNSDKRDTSDVSILSSVSAAVGGQIGRFVAGPAAPIQQYMDVMIAGLLASLVVNYMALKGDGKSYPYKDPWHKFPKKTSGLKDDKKYLSTSASDSFCYVRRGGGKDGYWINAVCLGKFAPTAIYVGFDTIAHFVVAALVLIVRHGGLKSNLRELLGLLAGITIGSEGYARWEGSNYITEFTYDPKSGGKVDMVKDDSKERIFGYQGPMDKAVNPADAAYFRKAKDGTWSKETPP
jgi:hypothetical protein